MFNKHSKQRGNTKTPRGDEKHKLIYDEMVNILGKDNFSDDLVVVSPDAGGVERARAFN